MCFRFPGEINNRRYDHYVVVNDLHQPLERCFDFVVDSSSLNLFQTVIGSVGGVELLYPILEQVHLPLRKRAESNGDELKSAEVKPDGEGETPSPPPKKESPITTPDVAWWFDGMDPHTCTHTLASTLIHFFALFLYL